MLKLQIGGSTQTVSVTGESPLLKTDRADVSNTLTGRELGKLPILDRNVTHFIGRLAGCGAYSSAACRARKISKATSRFP